MPSEDSPMGAASLTHEDEERFRSLLDLSPDQVAVHDMDGRFLYLNDAVCARHGYSRDEFMAMHPWDFAVNVNQQYLLANLRAMVPGEPIVIEDMHRCKDGSIFPVEARIVRFRDGGRDLIVAFCRDITSRRRAEDTLRMQERNRLAQDIHDTIASGLTAIAVQLEAASQVINEGLGARCEGREGQKTLPSPLDPHPSALLAVHVENALQTARESLRETRRSLQVLGRPVALGKGDLAEALRQLVGSRASGRQEKLHFVLRGQPRPLPGDMEDHLLRIGQETLTNVLKHAHATQALVVLAYNPCDLILSIEDDGQGMEEADEGREARGEADEGREARGEGRDTENSGLPSPLTPHPSPLKIGLPSPLTPDPSPLKMGLPSPRTPDPSPHHKMGLSGMRERAEHIGAKLVLRSVPGSGTSVTVTVPIPLSPEGSLDDR